MPKSPSFPVTVLDRPSHSHHIAGRWVLVDETTTYIILVRKKIAFYYNTCLHTSFVILWRRRWCNNIVCLRRYNIICYMRELTKPCQSPRKIVSLVRDNRVIISRFRWIAMAYRRCTIHRFRSAGSDPRVSDRQRQSPAPSCMYSRYNSTYL